MTDEPVKCVNLAVAMSPEFKETIREEAGERDMTMSAYARCNIVAGRKQFLALEDEIEGENEFVLEKEVLDAVPVEPTDALSHEEVAEEVISKVRQRIYELLDTDDRIAHSAAHGGYYVE